MKGERPKNENYNENLHQYIWDNDKSLLVRQGDLR